jgi:hypothetical protein
MAQVSTLQVTLAVLGGMLAVQSLKQLPHAFTFPTILVSQPSVSLLLLQSA